MATYNKHQQWLEYTQEGVVNLATDQLTVALATNANAPSVSADLVLADVTEISYTNLSNRDITTASSAQASGTYKLTLTDKVLTASGAVATFRHSVFYDNTPTSPADPIISNVDHGSDVTLANGETYTYDFDGTNGFYTIA